jgi:hypothetical protein
VAKGVGMRREGKGIEGKGNKLGRLGYISSLPSMNNFHEKSLE